MLTFDACNLFCIPSCDFVFVYQYINLWGYSGKSIFYMMLECLGSAKGGPVPGSVRRVRLGCPATQLLLAEPEAEVVSGYEPQKPLRLMTCASS